MSDSYYEHLFGVRDKVVLITGGTRGVGLMIAEGMVRCGARVYVTSRKASACDEAQAKLSKFGVCTAIACDISTLTGCRTLANHLKRREDHLHVLVNNAGVTWGANIDEFPEKAWDSVMDLDVKTPFFLTQQLLPLLRAAARPDTRSTIINVTSVNGLKPSGLQNYSYVAAKAGLGQLSAQMARDLMDEHINVNAIAPGPFQSKMTAPLYTTDATDATDATDEAERNVVADLPMKRWGAVEDIAGLTIFLASKAGSYLTGVTIPCDGGATTTG